MAEKRQYEVDIAEDSEKLQDLQDKDQVMNMQLSEIKTKIAKLKAEWEEYDLQRQGQQPSSPVQTKKKDKKKKKKDKESKKQAEKQQMDDNIEQSYNPLDQYELKPPTTTKLFADDPQLQNPNESQDFEFAKHNQSASMMFMNETGKSMVFNDTMNSDQTQINLNMSGVSKRNGSPIQQPSQLI